MGSYRLWYQVSQILIDNFVAQRDNHSPKLHEVVAHSEKKLFHIFPTSFPRSFTQNKNGKLMLRPFSSANSVSSKTSYKTWASRQKRSISQSLRERCLSYGHYQVGPSIKGACKYYISPLGGWGVWRKCLFCLCKGSTFLFTWKWLLSLWIITSLFGQRPYMRK